MHATTPGEAALLKVATFEGDLLLLSKVYWRRWKNVRKTNEETSSRRFEKGFEKITLWQELTLIRAGFLAVRF